MAKIQNQHILKSAPLLASILGDKYGVRVEVGGATAFTDGNTINLPCLPADCDDEFLILLKGYIDHESAHIRYSDFGLLQQNKFSELEKYVWNCIEDWRIEKLMARHFAGCKTNLHWLIYHIFHTNKKEKKYQLQEALTGWILLSIRSWDVPALTPQVLSLAKIINRECPRLLTELGLLLSRVQKHCESPTDALYHAKEIVACIERYIKQMEMAVQTGMLEQVVLTQDKQAPKGDAQTILTTQGSSTISQKTGENNEQKQKNEDATPKNQTECQTDNQAGALPDQGSEKPQQSKPHTQKGEDNETSGYSPLSTPDNPNAKGYNNILTSLRDLLDGNSPCLQNNMAKRVKQLIEKEAKEHKSALISVASTGVKYRGKLSDQSIQNALRVSASLKARLQGLLQAQSLSRRLPSSHGKINRNRLHALSANDSKVFLRQTDVKATNTAIHILLDTSASMQGKIYIANEACFALASALENTKGINVGVTAFPALIDTGNRRHRQLRQSSGNSRPIYVFPIIAHGAKVTPQFHISPHGSTPLTESLWWVLPNLLSQKEERKIILLITDGEPDDRGTAIQTIAHANKIGIEIYGIGIPPCNTNNLLPGKSITLENIKQLPQAMFGLLQSALVEKN